MPDPYAYQRDGSVVVMADGPDLLVYSGANDSPLWSKFCEGINVSVAATPQHVLALDTDGKLTWYRIIDGEKQDQVRFHVYVRSIEVAPDGLVAGLANNAVVLVRPGGDPASISVPKARSLGFGPGGASLGVGCTDGSFYALDPATGQAWGSCKLEGPVKGVAWSESGVWLVTVGKDIVMVAKDGSAETDRIAIAGESLGEITCSRDGALVAAVQGTQNIALYELQNKASFGLITAEREVGGLCFGPACWLGVGFDDGDANRVDLLTGNSTRTEAHPGRGQNHWGLGVQVRKELVRGAMAWVRAGGSPLAERTKHAWDQPKGTYADEEEEKKGGGCMRTVIIFLIANAICCGCSGIGAGIWYLVYGGLGPLAYIGT